MAHKGCRCIWENSLEPKSSSLNYHWADRNNRMYLCDCHRSFRIGKEVKHTFGNRHKRTSMQKDRWIALGAK